MHSAIDSSLSGLAAASTRVAVAADNIANVRSTAVTEVKRDREADAGDRRPPPERPSSPPEATPAKADGAAPQADGAPPQPVTLDQGFVARRVAQIALEPGGTRAVVRPVEPPSVRAVEPDAGDADENGIVRRPNVSLDRQFGDLVQAQRAYEASLKTVETVDRMLGTFLDQKF